MNGTWLQLGDQSLLCLETGAFIYIKVSTESDITHMVKHLTPVKDGYSRTVVVNSTHKECLNYIKEIKNALRHQGKLLEVSETS